ncbi:uncharacterized protein C8R40DRAFT_1191159 [Lentinula edodes]|uniref:uncharacterized protein n=1 Tax=Lentinula edodes TaxID=5353 RepID=UPI001E8DEDFC|nr:uncharacterized protein C8R40DRAFT_1191159 [Lentinula edodes]KAH7880198.1 hypothetical protein C8R40DRAFT_1191159 [Lentinula edodes]
MLRKILEWSMTILKATYIGNSDLLLNLSVKVQYSICAGNLEELIQLLHNRPTGQMIRCSKARATFIGPLMNVSQRLQHTRSGNFLSLNIIWQDSKDIRVNIELQQLVGWNVPRCEVGEFRVSIVLRLSRRQR